jgi:LAGLIDADG DNA endonuclease family protein
MELSLAYIAGFFDGEGHISVQPRKGLQVVFTNTRLDLLTDIQSFLGGVGKLTPKWRSERDGATKPCWYLRIWGWQAEGVLRQLLPYLYIKKEEAELGLEFMTLIVRRYPGQARGPRLVSEENWAHRESLAAEIKKAKRRWSA